MIATEKMDCGSVGFLGVRDVAIVSDRVIASRGDLAERYRKVQLRSDQLMPDSLLPLAYLGLLDMRVHTYTRSNLWGLFRI